VLQTVVFPVIDSTLGSTPAGQMASLAAGFAIGFATPGGANRGGSAAHGGSSMPHISGFDGTVSHVKVPDVGAVRVKVPDVPSIHGKVPDMPGIKAPDAPVHAKVPDVPDVPTLHPASPELQGITKPYSNSRPPYGKGQVENVWNAHVDPTTGKVTDPSGALISWDRSLPRKGQWDMGHIPGQKYSETHGQYMKGEIDCAEFLKWYKDPVYYRPELPITNQSHKFE